MGLQIRALEVLRDADGAIDERRLVLGVGELQPGWAELQRYSGPLPPQAVRALEAAGVLVAGESGANPQ